MNTNPYESPLGRTLPPQKVGAEPAQTAWRPVFVWWELRRIPYNLLVGAIGVWVLVQIPSDRWTSLIPLETVIYGLAANVCYFLGPLANIYLRYLGLRWRYLSWSLYLVGLTFSMLLTAVVGALMLVTTALGLN